MIEFAAVFVSEEGGSLDINEECVEEEDPLITASQSSKGEEGGSVDIMEECVEEEYPLITASQSSNEEKGGSVEIMEECGGRVSLDHCITE